MAKSNISNNMQPIDANEQKEGGGQIVLYQPGENISIEVKLSNDYKTVWLSIDQMALLFGRDKSVVGKHVRAIFKEGELSKESVWAKFAYTASDGKTYKVDFYNLDVIISVGYRVKSKQGTLFRIWATNTLRNYLLQGYSINRQLIAMQERNDERFMQIEHRLDDQQKQVEFLVEMHSPTTERVFSTGCVFDAWEYISALIRSAKNRVILIDNYCDERTLTLLAKRTEKVECTIHTRYNESFKEDFAKHNRQYPEVKMIQLPHQAHDRFLILDDDVYILGDSIKDIGHSLTTVLKTGFTPDEILAKLR